MSSKFPHANCSSMDEPSTSTCTRLDSQGPSNGSASVVGRCTNSCKSPIWLEPLVSSGTNLCLTPANPPSLPIHLCTPSSSPCWPVSFPPGCLQLIWPYPPISTKAVFASPVIPSQSLSILVICEGWYYWIIVLSVPRFMTYDQQLNVYTAKSCLSGYTLIALECWDEHAACSDQPWCSHDLHGRHRLCQPF